MTGPYRPDPPPEPTAKWWVHWMLNTMELVDRRGVTAALAFLLGLVTMYGVFFIKMHAHPAEPSAAAARERTDAARLHHLEYRDQCGTLCVSLNGYALSDGQVQQHLSTDWRERPVLVPFCTCAVLHEEVRGARHGEVRRFYGYDFHEYTP